MNSPELHTTAYLEGELNEADAKALADWLNQDGANLRAFVDQCWLDSQLRDVFFERRIHATLRENLPRIAAEHAPPAPSAPPVLGALLGGTVRYLNRPAIFSILFATVTLLSFVLTAKQVPHWFKRPESQAANAIPESPQFVAELVHSLDAKWSDDAQELRPGERLYEGQKLPLEQGLAVIAYRNGARLILQGPGAFTMSGPEGFGIDAGRVTVFVPASARGFQVATPKARIVDLGTEFGVSVDEQSNTEVHVFSGRVYTSSSIEPERGELHLLANQSVTYHADGLPTKIARAQPERFIRDSRGSIARTTFQQVAGARHLAFEAEHFDQNRDRVVDDPGWLVASLASPIEFAGRRLLPAGANASGGAAIVASPQPAVPVEHAGLVSYRLMFQESGMYHVYLRVSLYECLSPGGYGNEDSLFLPVPDLARGFGPASLVLHNLGLPPIWAPRPLPIEGRYDWWSRTSTSGKQVVHFEPYPVAPALLGRSLTFSLSTREGGLSVDRIVLSLDERLTSSELDALPNSLQVGGAPAPKLERLPPPSF